MRLLYLSDLHANDRWFTWLAEVSERFDAVAIAGDLLDLNAHRANGNQLERVIAHLRRIRVPLLLCGGNHDSLPIARTRMHEAAWMKELRRPNVWVDGDEAELAGIRFRCLPWQSPLPIAGPNEVWLHHAPPAGVQTAFARGGCGFGDITLQDHCEVGLGPRLLLGGHVHDPERQWAHVTDDTLSLNPGFAAGADVPNYFVLDFSRARAFYTGAGGASAVIRLW